MIPKFHSTCKNLDDQARSGRPKTMDYEAVLQTIDANRVALGEYQARLASHNSLWFVTFMTSIKSPIADELCATLSKYCKNFDSSEH